MRETEFSGNRSDQAGFTLIELMIVVVIIGVLGAIVYPSYQNYMENARLSDGRNLLVEAAARMERCHAQEGSYGNCEPFLREESENGYYRLVTPVQTSNSDQAYSLAARRVDVEGFNECGDLTLDQTGRRGATGGDPQDCW